MAKTKHEKKAGRVVVAEKGADHKSKVLTSVKDGRVNKPAEAPPANAKKLAKKAQMHAAKTSRKAAKKLIKAPTPPPESESEDESGNESGSSDTSGSDSDSGSDKKKMIKVSEPAKANGAAKLANGAAQARDSDSGSDSDADDSNSESDSDTETVPSKVAANVKGGITAVANAVNGSITAATNAVKNAAAAVADDTSDDSSDSDSEGEDQANAGSTPKAAVVNGATGVASSDKDSDEADDDDSSAGSSSDSSDDENEVEAAPPAKKRKAEAVETPAAKKTKTTSSTDTPVSKNLFVGNLSWNVDEDWLRQEFAEFGAMTGCRIITDRETGRAKGFGYVEFENEEDAIKALEAKKNSMLDGREMNVDFSTPRGEGGNRSDRVNDRASKFGDAKSVPSDTLFVGNISFSATAEMFQETFGEFGNITRVTLPTDPDSGALKGFGYVGFTSVEEAQAAMDGLNGTEIAGRNVRLDFSTPRVDGGGRGGSRGGRGGDRGGRGGGFRGGRGGDRGGRGGGFRGGRGGDRGGRGGRGDFRGGRGGRGGFSTNRGGIGDFSGKKVTF